MSSSEKSEKKSEVRRVTLPKEELVVSTPNQRNWRGILIALLVILVVLGLIVFSIALLSPPDEGPRVKGQKFLLKNITTEECNVPRFNGSWISDLEFVFKDTDGGLSVFHAENQTIRPLLSNSAFRRVNAQKFLLSSDRKYVLLISEIRKVFKRSFEAKYSICDRETGDLFSLMPLPHTNENPFLQLATWSPTGNAIAFIYENNIYYKPNAKSQVYQVTTTGEPGVIFNGVPDWLYEEEILQSNSAMWFSKDSSYLLFASFNDTLVGEYKYSWYGKLDTRKVYPEIRSLRYPKAGKSNPEVTLFAVNLSDASSLDKTDLKPPVGTGDISERDHYFTAATWVDDNDVSVVWMNRGQNASIVSLCKRPLWYCDSLYIQRESDSGWVDIYEAPIFSEDRTMFILRLPVQEGDSGNFKHVNLIYADRQPPLSTPLTQGKYDVVEIVAWDEENHWVYYIAAPESKPGQRHLYRVSDFNSSVPKTNECMTCETNNLTEKACSYSSVMFSPKYEFYIHECLGPELPVVSLYESHSNTCLTVIDDNSKMRDLLAEMALPQVKTFQVEVSDGYKAQVRLHLPPGYREHEDMMFPLVLHVYGAPGTQLVSDKWEVEWGTYLASQRNFIYVQIDGRGSGFQGDRFLHEIYHGLGSVEVEDQIAVMKYLRDNLKFVDKEKVAVWGWGYGGYITALILIQDTEKMFNCGIAVAPISSWQHYDSVYAERYLGHPQQSGNFHFYEASDITRQAANLKNKTFLLIHGTADDSVHYQQSMFLVTQLIEQGVIFRQQTYPDEDHTFSGVKEHLYKLMEDFLNESFGPLDFVEWESATSFFNFKQ